MRASEILRKLADVMDQQTDGIEQRPAPTEITNRPEVVDVEVDEPVDTHSIEGTAQVNIKTMVPPLQQKLDLMKKLAGIDHGSIEVGGDEGECCPVCSCDPCACDGEPQDEMSIMRRNAGIAPVIAAIADEDEPSEG